MSDLSLSNSSARRLWLDRHGLWGAPAGALDVPQIGADLGFVQLDSIRHVERAHDHILWSRNASYRAGYLGKHLENRDFFEHFTHDASLIPMQYLPMWRRQFLRHAEKITKAGWWKNMPDAEGRAALKARIAREGPLSTKDFDSAAPRPKAMWQRPAHKLGLDYMWYAGELATSHRKNFVKYYDLAERVFPKQLQSVMLSDAEQIDWLCRAALERLGFGNAGDIQRFWGACTAAEVKAWLEAQRGALLSVSVQQADHKTAQLWALPELEARLAGLAKPSRSMRLLNPFDPAIRDRKRTERLFGFSYRNEIFVPEAQRQWGYYVYPLLEGERFVGRVLLRADRKSGCLHITELWPEDGVKWGAQRGKKWQAEFKRFARFAGLEPVLD
ncbi:winged helix-turn-helix domain-containing protein [Lentibacter sp.]|uniref:winged helix-turn-helix domain-containing protein n=1 Tax=Lentibacter sp. TaxID=2024994 RepID=UPI003F6A099A